MPLVVDQSHLGTPASLWRTSSRIATTPLLELPAAGKVVLVSPHPDDEVLGAGGLIQVFLALEFQLTVVAVTDGDSSHPFSEIAKQLDLASVRTAETREALSRLGWNRPQITRLKIPDGKVSEYSERLRDALDELLEPGDLCVGPWHLDGHPDHDACGDVIAMVAQDSGIVSLSYLVWALHWADPEGSQIPWESSRRIEMSAQNVARKRWATGAFRSQTRPLGASPHDAAILPPAVLRRHWLRHEIFIDSRSEIP